MTRALAGALAAAIMATGAGANAAEIAIQSGYPPLQFTDAAPGGAHPIGGPVMNFVNHANRILGPLGHSFSLHAAGNVNPADAADVGEALVEKGAFATPHAAVAAGAANGGLNAAAGLPANSGLSFGEMMSGGAPFGLEIDELIAFVYEGGGLELVQSFYDEAFDGGVKVLPIAMTSAQGAGFFSEPLPDPDGSPELSAEDAMAELCRRPIIVRWPDGGAAVWAEACARVGVEAVSLKRSTRCADSGAICDPAKNPDNPVEVEPTGLTFGGFAPGVIPQTMFANGNIDAYELNMPGNDIQLLKLALGVQDQPDSEVDLSGVVAPYGYAGAWHQPSIFVELLINKAFWNGLPESDRALIEATARSAVVTTFAERLARQGDAIAYLEGQGVTYLRWPEGLIGLLREAAPTALGEMAETFEQEGDDTMARLHAAMTAYQETQAIYSDFGDVTQGLAGLPTSPKE